MKEDRESIAKIWTEYHLDKDGITAVIPITTYSKMYSVSQKYPLVNSGCYRRKFSVLNTFSTL
jgi:hypothetical protein